MGEKKRQEMWKSIKQKRDELAFDTARMAAMERRNADAIYEALNKVRPTLIPDNSLKRIEEMKENCVKRAELWEEIQNHQAQFFNDFKRMLNRIEADKAHKQDAEYVEWSDELA